VSQKPTISVVISVYNAEPYLDRCLKSVLSQTYQPIDVIVIDDGSRGSCKKIVSRFNKVQYIRHPYNRGLFAARLTGVKAATGQYIAFVDADDYVESEMCEALILQLEKEHADVAQCGAFLAFEDGRKTRDWWYRVSNFCISGDAVCQVQLAQNKLFYIWNKLYRRELFKKIPEKYYLLDHITMHEDILFSALLFVNVRKMVSNKDPYYHYVYRENAETKAIEADKVIRQMQSSAKVCDMCTEIMHDNHVTDQCALDVPALRGRLAKLYYSNKIRKIADPLEMARVIKEFKRLFNESAVSAMADIQSTSIFRKIYNLLLPPFSTQRYKLKQLLRIFIGYRN